MDLREWEIFPTKSGRDVRENDTQGQGQNRSQIMYVPSAALDKKPCFAKHSSSLTLYQRLWSYHYHPFKWIMCKKIRNDLVDQFISEKTYSNDYVCFNEFRWKVTSQVPHHIANLTIAKHPKCTHQTQNLNSYMKRKPYHRVRKNRTCTRITSSLLIPESSTPSEKLFKWPVEVDITLEHRRHVQRLDGSNHRSFHADGRRWFLLWRDLTSGPVIVRLTIRFVGINGGGLLRLILSLMCWWRGCGTGWTPAVLVLCRMRTWMDRLRKIQEVGFIQMPKKKASTGNSQ